MSFDNDKINGLKLKLQSATRRNIKSRKMEISLRNLERTLTEDISFVTSECDFMLQQMEDLKNQISQTLNQISITQICNVSEKSKIEHQLSMINAHKRGFEVMFARERKMSELHNKELEKKEAEQEAVEQQKIAKVLEMNELKGKEAVAVESECEALERECSVLTKRNKAMMLKLRRKLLDAEDTRRELMKKNGCLGEAMRY